MKNGVSKLLMVTAAVVLSAGLSVVARGATSQTVSIVAGKAETIPLPQAAADILVANPGVADVGPLRSDKLYVVGRGVGDTNILAFDAAGAQLADIAVHVSVDDDTLRKTLKEFFPREHIDARTVGNNVVLKGTVSTPAVANQIRDLATRFIGAAATNRTLVDLMTVRGEQQVMLKVKVLEVKRDLLREMGISFEDAASGAFGLNGNTGGGHPITGGFGSRQLFGLSAEQFGSGVLSIAQRGKFGPIDVNIDGLETDGLVSTLAEPTLTAISGESAGFLAGGEFPIPAARDNQGNVTLEFHQFGISLNFIPTVLAEDNISLQLTSEVSSRSDADGVTLQGTLIPGLAVRRAQTTVQMGSGGTLMIAGLLSSSVTQGLNGMPGLKDLPILGELFKSKSFRRGESELVFMVTPYLVEPFADQQAERVVRNDDNILHSILETDKNSLKPVTAPANMPGKGGVPVNVPKLESSPVLPQKTHYERQGEENRTAGEKGASLGNEVWRPRSVRQRLAEAAKPQPEIIGAPEVDADPADVMPVMSPDHPALTLPVAGKLSMNEMDLGDDVMPLPHRKPVMGDGSKSALKKTAEAARLASIPAVETEELHVKPVVDKKTAKLAAAEPAAGDSGKGKKTALLAKADVVMAPLPRRKPVSVADSKALSETFMNSLKKTYGNHVSAKLGEGKSYGYIVD